MTSLTYQYKVFVKAGSANLIKLFRSILMREIDVQINGGTGSRSKPTRLGSHGGHGSMHLGGSFGAPQTLMRKTPFVSCLFCLVCQYFEWIPTGSREIFGLVIRPITGTATGPPPNNEAREGMVAQQHSYWGEW